LLQLLAETMKWFGQKSPLSLRNRTIVEEYARDSWENLIFSICRFRELTGRYPERLTILGLAFKEYRFQELHRRAIRWPKDRFDYVGFGAVVEIPDGERVNAIEPFSRDLYACSGLLRKKKLSRDPFRRFHGIYGYTASCPEMSELLRFCSRDGQIISRHLLPWPTDDLIPE
jgi:hypothetical protein